MQTAMAIRESLRTAALALLAVTLLTGCREGPLTPPVKLPVTSPYHTIAIDHEFTPVGDPSWYGVAVLLGGAESTFAVSVNSGTGHVRFSSCVSLCDTEPSWSSTTIDSVYLPQYTLGAVRASTGIHVIYGNRSLSYLDTMMIRYAHCAAACGSRASWSVSTLFPGVLELDPNQNTPLVVDGVGALHLVGLGLNGMQGLVYAYCGSGCGNPGSWAFVGLDTAAQRGRYAIAMDATGRLDVANITGQPYSPGIPGGLQYRTCAAACTSAGNWSPPLVVDTSHGLETVAVALGAGGAVNVAYAKDIGNQALLPVLIAMCSAGCDSASHWQMGQTGLHTEDNLSLTIGPAGGLYLVTTGDVLHLGICAGACNSPDGWQTMLGDRDLGSGDVSVVVDGAGQPRTVSTSDLLLYSIRRR